MERDSESSLEHCEDGVIAREEQRWSDAADAYWKALEADLENYIAHVRYQECAVKAGDDVDELKADYDKFREEFPKNIGMRLHRLRLDEPKARLEKLAGLVKKWGKNFNVHLEIGRARLAAGEAKASLPAFEKANALKTVNRPDVLLLYAEAEHAAGMTAEAIARLDAAVKAKPESLFDARLVLSRLLLITGQNEESAKQAGVLVEQRPKYIAAFLVKSEALVGAGKDEEARTALKSAYRVNKENDAVCIAYADLWVKFGTDAAYKQGIKLYEEVIARDEESWRALYGYGWALELQEKYEEAEEKYREVMAIRPELVAAVNSVGYVMFKQGRVSEAQIQFKRALDMEPSYATALANLASTLDAQAKYGEAIDVYEKILKMKGQEENLRAIVNCAFDYEATGVFPKALKLLKQAHETMPKDANIVVWIGDNHYFQKKWKEAETWYQKAIALDEKLFFAWRGLGLTLGQRKRWADAAQALEKASKLKPDDIELYATLGDIYWQELKDFPKALKKYEEFIQRGGNDPEVRDAILTLKKAIEDKK